MVESSCCGSVLLSRAGRIGCRCGRGCCCLGDSRSYRVPDAQIHSADWRDYGSIHSSGLHSTQCPLAPDLDHISLFDDLNY